jgi:hypothetical protein
MASQVRFTTEMQMQTGGRWRDVAGTSNPNPAAVVAAAAQCHGAHVSAVGIYVEVFTFADPSGELPGDQVLLSATNRGIAVRTADESREMCRLWKWSSVLNVEGDEGNEDDMDILTIIVAAATGEDEPQIFKFECENHALVARALARPSPSPLLSPRHVGCGASSWSAAQGEDLERGDAKQARGGGQSPPGMVKVLVAPEQLHDKTEVMFTTGFKIKATLFTLSSMAGAGKFRQKRRPLCQPAARCFAVSLLQR